MVYGCMVCRERSETAAVSRGTSHVKPNSAVSTLLGWIFKTRLKKKKRKKRKGYSPSFRMTFDKRAVSLLESGE